MGGNALSGFLKSLCENSCWIYAIFWKLQHENQMFLSWEDWYCDYPKVRALTGNSPDELSTDVNQFLSFDDGGGIIDRTASQIAFAVARTSCLEYKPGEGIIGEVVCTETHYWVSVDDVLAIHCKSETPFSIPDEWLPQISAGVKTILVLPLLPYGVLQLGSHEKVPEIKEAVNHIKLMFSSTGYEQARYAHLTPNKNPTHSLSSVLPFHLDNMDGSSLIDSIYVSGMQFDGPESGAEANRDRVTTCQVIDQLENLQEAADSETLVPPKGLPEISNLPSQPANANHRDMVDHNDLWFSGMVEDLLVFSKSHNLGMSAEFCHGLSDSCTANDTSEWSLKSTDADHANHGPTSNMFNFPTDCELHKALGPSFQGRAIETSVLFENAFGDPQMSHDVDYFYDVERSAEYLSHDDAEFLLETVIPNRYGSSQSPSPIESNITKLSVSSRQSDTSSNALNILEGRTSDENVSAVVIHRKDRVSVPSSPVSMKSTTRSFKMERWDEEDAPALARKGEKLLSGYKRRSRRGDNKKPRPRDRQLIQERLRELRILVPSSTKCSIDSLLERTIKHMLFLRRVTHQAEKLTKMETFEQKVVPQDNKNKWEYVPGHGRTNLAVQGGCEFQACRAPIAVEDLNQPGHMLIKVICNEQGLFLEIAQVITRLELTILKGIFENHSNDTWACFIVEASKDFQKMDIFWPLMQLLHCTRAKVSSKI